MSEMKVKSEKTNDQTNVALYHVVTLRFDLAAVHCTTNYTYHIPTFPFSFSIPFILHFYFFGFYGRVSLPREPQTTVA